MTEGDFSTRETLPYLAPTKSQQGIPGQVGPYKIESLLSSGGMSLLYLASHPKDHHPIVVKVLSPAYIAHVELKEQFMREAQIISLSDHPNIVKLFGQGEWEGGLYIAMEFIRGISLKQFILNRSLSLRRLLDIILQVAYALLHLHTNGIIHRDLKPENIILTESGGIKVVDFGISMLTGEETRPSFAPKGMIGTPNYMSPEQVKEPSSVDFTCDIYSLGVLAYELITGRLSLGQIQLSNLPKHLATILGKALQPDHSKRYQDIVDFIHDISDYIKSDRIQQDRNSEDELRELFELINARQREISLLPQPSTQTCHFGFALSNADTPCEIYNDVMEQLDGSLVVVVAKSTKRTLSSILDIAYLKGVVTAFVERAKQPLKALDLAKEINTFLHNRSGPTFYFTLMHLSRQENAFSIIDMGGQGVWHAVGFNDRIRRYQSTNPLLGTQDGKEIEEIRDNWRVDDILLLQTALNQDTKPSRKSAIESHAVKTLERYAGQGPQIISDTLLRAIEGDISETGSSHELVFALSRVE